jgi:hypothetical protein
MSLLAAYFVQDPAQTLQGNLLAFLNLELAGAVFLFWFV